MINLGKRVKIILFILLVSFMVLLFPMQKIKADSYTYDYFDKPLIAPDAFSVEKRMHLSDITNYEIDFTKARINDIIYAKDYHRNSKNDEVYLLDNYDTENNSRLIILDTNFKYKGKIELNGINATSMAYYDNTLYLADRAKTKIFTKQLVNPIDNSEILALPGDVYNRELELKIIDIHNKLYYINPELYHKLNFKISIESKYIKHVSYIHVLSRYDDSNNLLPIKNNKGLKEIRKISVDPKSVPGLNSFIPLKVSVSPFERIYVICQGSSEGILELDLLGNFQRFVGVNLPKEKLGDKITRFLGIDKKQVVFQTNFDNMAVDNSGFLYTLTGGTDIIRQVQRFNYLGENVLVENAKQKVVGDYFEKEIQKEKAPAKTNFTLIDINPYGLYMLYDTTRHRIFFYNENGELIITYGNKGDGIADLKTVKQIKFFNDKVLVLENDSQSENVIKVLKPTSYGKEILMASYNYHYGDFDNAKIHYENILLLNKNSNFANVGLGKVYFQKGDYKNATTYFKKGQNKLYYAEAYEKLRNDILKANFALSMTIISLIVVFFIYRGIVNKIKRKMMIQ